MKGSKKRGWRKALGMAAALALEDTHVLFIVILEAVEAGAHPLARHRLEPKGNTGVLREATA